MINHLLLGNCIIKFKFLLHNHELDTFCPFFCGRMQEGDGGEGLASQLHPVIWCS